MVREEKRHQMMQNLFGDQSEEEEEVESEHESNRQPDYASDEGDEGPDAEGEGEVEGQGEAEIESEGEPKDERDKSSRELETGNQGEQSQERYSESDDKEDYDQRVVTSRRHDAVESGSERSGENHYVANEDDEVNQARSHINKQNTKFGIRSKNTKLDPRLKKWGIMRKAVEKATKAEEVEKLVLTNCSVEEERN
ncbi:hypothetical protein SASPL_103393 [Salvia splendens]|uniref:Uncharacterized protein n=1 Tax=Salvia splendens TaxID=180675 RepID=A0A8X8YT12_SALSN|nr:hypothetical protein SASPL_103393 [Salvia splendens]